MPITEAQKRARQKYEATKSSFKLLLDKEKAEEIRAYANSINMSITDLFMTALSEYRENHKAE